MARREKQDHQPEPWVQNGRDVQDASGWTLASARFPADARRIVAAINAVQGIPTDALESWVINVIGEASLARQSAEAQAVGAETDPVPFPGERRVGERRLGERRRGDRRAIHPMLRILGPRDRLPEDESKEGGQ
jgi:hypothetical protein